MTPISESIEVVGTAESRAEAGKQSRHVIDHVLASGQERLKAELARLRSLGVIDEEGKLLITELPPDMLPGADRDFGG